LGTLGEDDASRVEERYFIDRGFFLLVQAIETALIEDYLAGRLALSAKNLFEARYLVVPNLRDRVEELRESHALAATKVRRIRNRLYVAAAVVLTCIGVGTLWLHRNPASSNSSPLSTGTRPVIASLSLSPGLIKGPSGAAKLGPLTRKGDVQLVLELPGQRTQLLLTAQVSVATSDGRWKRVWSTPQPVQSTPGDTGQQVVLTLDSSLLPRGDYLVELTGANERVHETYSFRVSPV